MQDSDLLDVATLFMAAATRLYPEARWPMDSHIFARTVEELAKTGNTFASRFFVHDTVLGRGCYQFDEMLSMALYLSYISYLSPGYKQFVLNVTPRQASRILDKSTESEREGATAVVAAYALACGLSP